MGNVESVDPIIGKMRHNRPSCTDISNSLCVGRHQIIWRNKKDELVPKETFSWQRNVIIIIDSTKMDCIWLWTSRAGQHLWWIAEVFWKMWGKERNKGESQLQRKVWSWSLSLETWMLIEKIKFLDLFISILLILRFFLVVLEVRLVEILIFQRDVRH